MQQDAKDMYLKPEVAFLVTVPAVEGLADASKSVAIRGTVDFAL